MTDPAPGQEPAAQTLGGRLAAEAYQLVARRLAAPAWLTNLEPVLRRSVTRTLPSGSRFLRVELVPAAPAGPAGPMPPAEFPQPRWPAGTIPPAAPPPAGQAASPLPADVRERLRAQAGAAADALRVHHHPAAGELARRLGAEAVTLGTEVFVPGDRFRPREPDGFALLAHEAAHVLAALRPNSAWRRATAAGRAEEERQALAAEQVARVRPHRGTGRPVPRPGAGRPHPGPPPAPSPPPDPLAAAAPATAAPRPVMAAAAGRDLGPPGRGDGPDASPPDLASLKDALYRDLLRQLRVELERGG